LPPLLDDLLLRLWDPFWLSLGDFRDFLILSLLLFRRLREAESVLLELYALVFLRYFRDEPSSLSTRFLGLADGDDERESALAFTCLTEVCGPNTNVGIPKGSKAHSCTLHFSKLLSGSRRVRFGMCVPLAVTAVSATVLMIAE